MTTAENVGNIVSPCKQLLTAGNQLQICRRVAEKLFLHAPNDKPILAIPM